MDSEKLDLFNHRVAKTVLANGRVNNDWLVNWTYSQKFLEIFPDSVNIKDEASLAAFYSNEYDHSVRIINDLLNLKPPRHMIARVMGNKKFCLRHLVKTALHEENVSDEIDGQLDNSPYIFVCRGTSATTVRNFIKHCSDAYLFSHFYYLYDKSEQTVKLELEFPRYFEFVKYDSSLLNSLGIKCYPYIFNMQGDWLFFDKRNYVTIMRDIVDSAGNGGSYGQVLMNQNYSHNVDDWEQEGNEKYTESERRYYEDDTLFDGSSPSFINREILYEYDFEANYKNTYKTALMDGIHVVRRDV